MPPLLLLSKRAIWLFSNMLCPLAYSPCILHHFCNVTLFTPPSTFYYSLSFNNCIVAILMMVLIFSVGCIVLYTGQGKFHSSTLDTLNYVVKQAHITSESLQNVSDYLAAAKTIGVNSVTLAPDVQSNIDKIDRKINSSATTLSYQTKKNSKDIKDALDSV